MANAITVGRLILLFIAVYVLYNGGVTAIAIAAIAIGIAIILDGLDGWVARRYNETGPLGAAFDIAGDRIAENVLWVVYADLGLIPIWVPLLMLTRGFLVDSLRAIGYGPGAVIRAFSRTEENFEYRQVALVNAQGLTAAHTGGRSIGLSADAEGQGCAAVGNRLVDRGLPMAMRLPLTATAVPKLLVLVDPPMSGVMVPPRTVSTMPVSIAPTITSSWNTCMAATRWTATPASMNCCR